MATLLVALVIVCALGIAVHVGRGLWSRGRSVQRHRQALDTLADITQSSGGSSTEGDHLDQTEHQAHVRLLGPAGEVARASAPEGSALPPPKALAPTQHANQSPFRRPSRSAKAAVAADGTEMREGSPGPQQRPHRMPGPPPIAPAITPPPGPIGADDIPEEVPDEATRAIPGLTPPPPAAAGPPTRPVPVIRPHVFYFDDLSPRTGPQRAQRSQHPTPPSDADAERAGTFTGALTGASAPAVLGAPAGPTGPSDDGQRAYRQRRLATQAIAAAAVALVVAGGAVYVALNGHSHPNDQAASSGGPVTTSKASTVLPTATSAPAATTTTTSPAATTTSPSSSTTTSPPKPVLLLSATGGTDTYKLTSTTASIVVTAKGPCWVEVRVGNPQGQVVTEETLESGEKVTTTGPAWIRLGDPPYATVSVDGSPTTVPGAQYGVPLDLNFTVS